ncbi:MAG: hypothetical protein A3D35_02200 [Candidatus Staskawiczbacteria bacterium RIFCSPHIGHO2_02_FULL_34_9]|uniref:SCP domain-containing protein n=1 Tax=Candidatus Staskawiczbacteria bacterium RIFCSPHIGHO2_02_FULL_34_9 TaxID=1802206 RepID=A0A1G2I150_9BACT|nr:MAG: hypothetical protein A3D35_02200 [Candidatus Staskawiczbacteria bacterium RIFCSPHIGHO2_02_FULL_34_9]
MKKYYLFVVTLLLVILASLALFYYRNSIFDFYDKTTESLSQISKTDLGSVVTQLKKEVFTPSPLNIGGQENEVEFTKEKIIAQTNVQRYNNGGLLPVVENSKLDAAALAKAQDMFSKQYFEHVSPLGVGPGDLVKSFGYDYIVVGENLILGNFGSEKEIVQAWMDSPGHRANILNDRVTEIGVAIIKGTYEGRTVWIGVQEFGLPISACQQTDSSLKNQIDTNKAKLDQLSTGLDNKRAEIDGTNPKSPKYNKLIDEYNEMVKEYNELVQTTKNLITQYNNEINVFNQCVQGTSVIQ